MNDLSDQSFTELCTRQEQASAFAGQFRTIYNQATARIAASGAAAANETAEQQSTTTLAIANEPHQDVGTSDRPASIVYPQVAQTSAIEKATAEWLKRYSREVKTIRDKRILVLLKDVDLVGLTFILVYCILKYG